MSAIGYIGLDVPVELISAAGLTPVRVTAAPRSDGADAFGEGLGNPQLRGLAAALIEGPFRALEKLVISPTPAAYGWLYAFLRALKQSGESPTKADIYLFDLNRGGAPGLDVLRRKAVADLAERIETWSGTRLDLPPAIAAANRTRRLKRQVQALRTEGTVAAEDALSAFAAGDGALEALIRCDRASLPGRRLVYSGAETHDYAGIDGLVIADDQDGGSRSIGPDVDEAAEPLASLAARYLHRDPGPARSNLADRTAYLVGLAQAAKAEAVVFDLPVWDHPANWEAPALRAALAAAGVASESIDG